MLKKTSKGILLSVKVIPNASKSEIVGLENTILKIRLAAIPDKGEANAELIRMLSKITKIPKSQISIIRGLTSRNKTVAFEEASEELLSSCLRSYL